MLNRWGVGRWAVGLVLCALYWFLAPQKVAGAAFGGSPEASCPRWGEARRLLPPLAFPSIPFPQGVSQGPGTPGVGSFAPPMAWQWPVSLTLSAGSLLWFVALEAWIQPSLRQSPRCPLLADGRCDAIGLPALDRWSLAYHDGTWRLISNVAQWAAFASPLFFYPLAAFAQGHGQIWLEQSVLGALTTLEATSVATALIAVLKMSTLRPRPEAYRNPTTSLRQQVSMPSGHTGAVAAATMSVLMTLYLQEAPHAFRWWAGGVAGSLIATTALGRVLGGKHFVSDVLIGGLLGLGVGYVIPWLRWTHQGLTPTTVQQGPETALHQLRLSPWFPHDPQPIPHGASPSARTSVFSRRSYGFRLSGVFD